MTAIVFTDRAARKVRELVEEEGNPNLKLRAYVTGGGCSGFQYGFTFTETVEEDDTQIVNQGMALLIDPMSFQYLSQATIDYQEDVNGAQFSILNPNAKSTCGCGSSFSVEVPEDSQDSEDLEEPLNKNKDKNKIKEDEDLF